MARDPKEMLNELMRGLGAVGELDSHRTQAYLQFVEASEKPGALDGKVKQLIGLAVGIYARCDYCIVYHTNEALKAGATPEELMETGFVAGSMDGGPAMAHVSTLLQDSITTFAPDYGE